jgi:hypothetical protein
MYQEHQRLGAQRFVQSFVLQDLNVSLYLRNHAIIMRAIALSHISRRMQRDIYKMPAGGVAAAILYFIGPVGLLNKHRLVAKQIGHLLARRRSQLAKRHSRSNLMAFRSPAKRRARRQQERYKQDRIWKLSKFQWEQCLVRNTG